MHLDFEQPFLSLWGPLHFLHAYSALSWEHATQWIGGIIFAVFPVVPLLLGIALVHCRKWAATWLGWASVLTALIISAASFLVFNYYPHPRDWDLFAIPGFLQLACLMVLVTRCTRMDAQSRFLLMAGLLIALLWDGSLWLGYNLTWGPPVTERYLAGF